MRQPKALRLLSWVQMWKFFSHYGIRTVLILYLVSQLKMDDGHAFGVNALFLGLVELGGLFGGLLADKYLGYKRATILGTWILACGYFCLVFEKGLFVSLALVVLGGSLFAGNLTAILGEAYEEGDLRRKSGFTTLYMMQNLGALVSSIVCGFLAKSCGYRVAILVAASGIVIGGISLYVWRGYLKGLGESPKEAKGRGILLPLFLLGVSASAVAISNERFLLPILPWMTLGVFLLFASVLLRDKRLPQKEIRLLFVYLGALVLFFAAEDQICSSLVIFAERETNRTLFGWTIPSALIIGVNPLVILSLGGIVTKWKLKRGEFILPFTLVSLSFGVLALVCLKQILFSVFGVMGIVVIISIAELMVGPLVMTIASSVAAKGRAGLIMGMVPLGFSLAFLVGGGLSKMVSTPGAYGMGFSKIALIVFVGGILLELFKWRVLDEKRLVRL